MIKNFDKLIFSFKDEINEEIFNESLLFYSKFIIKKLSIQTYNLKNQLKVLSRLVKQQKAVH